MQNEPDLLDEFVAGVFDEKQEGEFIDPTTLYKTVKFLINLFSSETTNNKYTILLDNIHKNHIAYLAKINNTKTVEYVPMAYSKSDSSLWKEEEAIWFSKWQIRNRNKKEDLENVIKAIKNTPTNQTIGMVKLRNKTIYLSDFRLESEIYKVAAYGNYPETEIKDCLTKQKVYDLDDLKTQSGSIRLNENAEKYFVLGFYEKKKQDPTVMLQIEKKDDKSVEEWLKYLGIYKPILKGEEFQEARKKIHANYEKLLSHVHEKHTVYANLANSTNKELSLSNETELTNEEKNWIKKWQARVYRKSYPNSQLSLIKMTGEKSKIADLDLNIKTVYCGEFKDYRTNKYKIALYGNGKSNKLGGLFEKFRVKKPSKVNREHVTILNNSDKWFALLFYEPSKLEPSMVLQFEKKDDKSLQYILESLDFIDLVGTEPVVKLDDDVFKDIDYFNNTDDDTKKKVIEAINKYSNKYGLTTKSRMSHFLGQVGYESAGFSASTESSDLTTRRIVELHRWTYNGHLYEEALFDEKKKLYTYKPINFNTGRCIKNSKGENVKVHKGTAKFDYKSSQEVVNAYGDYKVDVEEVDDVGNKI